MMLSMKQSRPRRLRNISSILVLIVIACMTPALIGVVFLVYEISKQDRQRETQNVVRTARGLMLALDRQFFAALASLEVLATSPDLLAGDYAGFHERTRTLIGKLHVNNIVLAEETGRQLLNTLVPYGEPLPSHTDHTDVYELVRRSGKPVTTALFRGRLDNKLRMAIGVPVFRDGRMQYALSMGMLVEDLAALVDAQKFPPGWIVSIVDSRGVVATRNIGANEFVGKPASVGFRNATTQQREGVVELTSLEGARVFAAFSRSGSSNWIVSIGVPSSDFAAARNKSLLVVGGATALLFAAALLVAVLKARMISNGLRRLIDLASALASGGVAPARTSDIWEIDEVSNGLEKAFKERSEALRERVLAETTARLKGDFIGTVSHELRTPLTSISASLDLISGVMDAQERSSRSRLVAIAHSNTARLTRLVNDILDIEKLEAGKVNFKLQYIELGSLLENAVEEQRPLAGSHDVKLLYEKSTAHVHADPDRLMQVFANLLSNAIKFSPPNSDVQIAVESRNDKLRVSVRDWGSGVSDDFKSQIFEKFCQADVSHSRGKGGSGLGLSIVKEIVQRLGGDVDFYAAPGGGTVFFVDLPRCEHPFEISRILPVKQARIESKRLKALSETSVSL